MDETNLIGPVKIKDGLFMVIEILYYHLLKNKF